MSAAKRPVSDLDLYTDAAIADPFPLYRALRYPDLERCGLGAAVRPDGPDPLADREPFLAELSAASILGRIATGRRADRRVLAPRRPHRRRRSTGPWYAR